MFIELFTTGPPLLLAFGLSLVASLALVLTKHWHGFLSMDSSHGVQKFHSAPTPRVGGIAVFVALGGVLYGADFPPPFAEVDTLLQTLFWAGLPAFVFGVAEDLTKRVGVAWRLLATIASGLVAWALSGYSLSLAGVPWLESLFLWAPLSVAFTAFAVGGVANALNIIDGFNGLSSLTAFWAFAGYAALAYLEGDTALAMASLLLGATVLGFFAVNWPFGKLFLGDGGAYFIGFALAWVAVMLLERNSGVNPFAALTVCVLPVTEVLFSVFRRAVRKEHPGMPDRLHFHSLLKKRYVRRWFTGVRPLLRNSITGALVGNMTLTAVLFALFTYHSLLLSALAFVVLVAGYVAMYARMVRYHWCSPIAFVLYAPSRA